MNLSKNWLADFVDVSDVDVKDYCDRSEGDRCSREEQ